MMTTRGIRSAVRAYRAKLPAYRAKLPAAVVLSVFTAALALACKPGAPSGLGDTPADVNISVDAVSLSTAGENVTLNAVAVDDEGFPIPGVDFTWRSSDEAVATVDDAGVVTAVGSGIAFVTATTEGVSSDPVTVTVRLPIADIDVQPPGISFSTIGEKQTLTATARDASGAVVPGVVFAWSSTDDAVATVASDGEVTAVGPGVATVTASADGETSQPVAVGVMLGVASIDVTPTSATLTFLGETTTLTAVARDATGAVVTGVTFTWASSDPNVASVSNSGVVTALLNGTTDITASVGAVSSADVAVTVQQLAATINVSPTTVDLASLGETATLSGVARDAGGAVIPGATFTWNSSAQAVATVSSSGVVSAVSNGTATVTARLDGATSNGVAVNVRQIVASISVTPPSLAFTFIGQTAQLTATALDALGSPVPGIPFTWASSNLAAATVSQTGLVTAIGAGLAQVTAMESGGIVSNAVIVRVVPAQVVFDAASSTAAVNTASIAWLHTIGGGSNRMLVVGVTAESSSSNAVQVSSVTYNGTALVKQIDEKATSTGGGFTSRVEIWILDDVRLPGAGTYQVVVTFQGTVAETSSGAISLEDVDQSSPEATASSSSLQQQSIVTGITTQTPAALTTRCARRRSVLPDSRSRTTTPSMRPCAPVTASTTSARGRIAPP